MLALPFFFLAAALLHELGNQILNLCGGRLLGGALLLIFFFGFVDLRRESLQLRVDVVDLRGEGDLVVTQGGLLLLALVADRLILARDALCLLARSAVLRLEGAVALHNGGSVVQRRQELAQTARAEDQDEDVDPAVFLDRADARTIDRSLTGFLRLCGRELNALIGDHLIVHLDLFADERERLFAGLDLDLQSGFLLEDVGLLRLQLLKARMCLVRLGGEFFPLALHLLDVAFIYGESGREHAQDQRERHDHCKKDREDGNKFTTPHMDAPLIRPSDNSGLRSHRRRRRQKRRCQDTLPA